MTTTIQKINGWKGTDLEVGMLVDVSPDAIEDSPGLAAMAVLRIDHIYANGYEVRVTDDGSARYKVAACEVRPAMGSGAREQKRTEEMEDLNEFTRQRLAKWLDYFDKEQEPQIPTEDVVNYLVWNMEKILMNAGRRRAYQYYGVTKIVRAVLRGECSVAEAAAATEICRQRMARDLQDRPYRHSSSSIMSNYEKECDTRALAGLLSHSNYNDPLAVLAQWKAVSERIKTEW